MKWSSPLKTLLLLPFAWLAVRIAWVHIAVGSMWAWLAVPLCVVGLLAVAFAVHRLCAPEARVTLALPVLLLAVVAVGSAATASEQVAAGNGVVGAVPLFLIRDDVPAWGVGDCFAHMDAMTPESYDIYLSSDAGDLLPMHRRTIESGLREAFALFDMRIHDGPPPVDPTGDPGVVHVHLFYNARIVDTHPLAGQYCGSQVQAVATSAAATWPTVVHEVGHHFGLMHTHQGFMVDTQQILDPPTSWTPAQWQHLAAWSVGGVPAPGFLF